MTPKKARPDIWNTRRANHRNGINQIAMEGKNEMRTTWISCAALLTLGLGTVFSGSMASAQTNRNQDKLRNQAKISMHQAETTALNKEPGTIKSKELEKEHGRLIYSFDIRTKQGIHEVNVDANTGAVVEDSVESNAAEQQEKKQEAHHH